MRHWLVTRRDGLEACDVITEDGKTPRGSGYHSDFWKWRELSEPEVEQREVERHRPGLLEYVRRVAGEKIVEIAPIWRQLNDLSDPESLGAIDRRAHIETVRTWSNAIEAEIKAASTLVELEALRAKIEELK